jgi:hypothetical protein
MEERLPQEASRTEVIAPPVVALEPARRSSTGRRFSEVVEAAHRASEMKAANKLTANEAVDTVAAVGSASAHSENKLGLVGPVVQKLQASYILDSTGSIYSMRRKGFVDGIEACASLLEALGGGIGGYLLTNAQKLRNSKATSTEDCFRAWLMSEMPVHKATSYKNYVDDSAFMANLWIGWLMEFFAELFRLLHQGGETKACVTGAYGQTLKAHHNVFQSTAFHTATRNMPSRQKLYETLRGSDPNMASLTDVNRDVGVFAECAKAVAGFCQRLADQVSSRMAEERKTLQNSSTSSRFFG